MGKRKIFDSLEAYESSDSEDGRDAKRLLKPKALPLITVQGDYFSVGQEAVEFLATLDGPISIVSVVGSYRSGKSFLLNRVLLERGGSFGVGSTINACTKGIWVWSEPLEYEGKTIIILDTEGLGAFNATDTHDSRIFALALLLSSYFIYNSVGTIDESAINTLSLVANLSKHIRLQSSSESNSEELGQYFPNFLWLIRDFALELCNEDGSPIDSKQYLENALADQLVQDPDKNRLRQTLRSFFPNRDCSTLIRPCTNESDLKQLDLLSDNQLRKEFIDQAKRFQKKVFKECPIKTALGKPINGLLFAELCRSFVQAINDGTAPAIKDSWTLLVQVQEEKARQRATQFLQNNIPQLPSNPEALHSQLLELKHEAGKVYQKECLEENNGNTVEQLLDDLIGDVMQKNEELCLALMHRNIRNLEVNSFDQFSKLNNAYQRCQSTIFEKLGDSEQIQRWWAFTALTPSWALFHNLTLESSLKVQQLYNETEQLKLKKQQWKEKLNEAENAIGDLQDKLAFQQKEQETSTTQWHLQREELLQDFELRVQQIRHDLETKEAFIEELQNQQRSDDLSAEQLTAQLQALKEEYSELSSDKERVDAELDQLRNQVQELRAEQARLCDDLKLKQTTVEEYQKTLASQQSDFQNDLNSLIKESTEKLNAIKQAHSGEVRDCQQKIRDLQTKLQNTEEQYSVELQEAQSVTKKATKALQRSEIGLVELRKQLDDKNAVLEKQEHTLSTIREKFAGDMQQIYEKQRVEHQRILQERTKLLQEMRELSTNSAVKDLKIETLNQQLTQSKRRSDASQITVQNALQTAELKRAEANVFELKQDINNANGKILKLEKQLKDQEREFEIAKVRLQMDYELQKTKGLQ